VAEHAAGRGVLALLGPASELGAALTTHREDLGQAVLRRWRALFDPADLVVEVVDHRVGGSGPTSATHAARMAGLARSAGVPAVLSNAVRYADRTDAVTVDVLDAARRLVPLDVRHVDRGNAEGFLKSGKEMAAVAEEVCRLAGLGRPAGEARALLARTRAVADRCAVDPRADLGLGEVHLPELDVIGDPGGAGSGDADAVLRVRCEAGVGRRYGAAPRQRIWKRLDDELQVIGGLGFASYFLTVADVCDMVRGLGIRSAARGSGAGSLVNYLLGVSGIDPLRHGLLMERFLSPLRQALPDIDIDVESARRLEVYDAILDRYGGERCVAVSMMDTYRVRHAIRDVGGALGMPGGEVDAIAKAFPHIRARDARAALRELPELRASGLGEERLGLLFRLAERLDGLPRHIAMHPCGVLLSDATLLDRTPVEASFAGYPMSQFDKDDVEDLGLLKLDVLGIRMQSAMAHAVREISRVDGIEIDLDDEAQVPFDDRPTYELVSSSRTLGCFQIESPGQRELVGKSGIETFEDVITDISLFRPGPVQSDMITPYLEAKQGWRMPAYLHDDLRPILAETRGVVVYHEQVIEIISRFTGCSLAEADEARRALGHPDGMARTRLWFLPRAMGRGYSRHVVAAIWSVLQAFGSFGFCKAHAAAFALPTYQSAWLKTHHTAHFLAGVLTHDPGMYPKRLILDDARQFGIEVLGLDVDASEAAYVVERLGSQADEDAAGEPARYGIRLALADVKGISEAEIARVVAARPYRSLTDFWQRAAVSRPVAERLVLAGALDRIYGITGGGLATRGKVTRRDLLLQVADLDRYARATQRGSGRTTRQARARLEDAAARNSSDPRSREGVWHRAQAQSQASPLPDPVRSVQLTLDLGDAPADALHTGEVSGLPELDPEERVRAELEILGLDASRHVMDSHAELLDAIGVTRAAALLERRSRAGLLVAGVKVATQTPPIRSGRRVVFLTLDDATGPVDVTFFEDALASCASTVFGSWLLVVRGELRRTGRRGVSLRATGCWELGAVHDAWRAGGVPAVHALMASAGREVAEETPGTRARRVLVHSTGFRLSPYADVEPAGESGAGPSRKLWHSSPGSPGR
jgi:error-prone DNA polymerase